MRVTCSACGAASDRQGLDALPGGFGFECPGCGHGNVLAPMAPPAAPPPAPRADAGEAAPSATPPEPDDRGEFDLPEGMSACPKCGHVQRDADACHRCGLMFSLVASGRAAFSTDPLEGHPSAKELRELWGRLKKDLDDDEGHRRFVERCSLEDALEFAGDCYRRLTSPGQPEDPRVGAYRQRVIAAAMARVGDHGRRMERAERKVGRLVVLLVAAIILLGFLVGYYVITRQQTRALLGG